MGNPHTIGVTGETDADEPNSGPLVLLADFGRDEPEFHGLAYCKSNRVIVAPFIAFCLAAYCFANTKWNWISHKSHFQT